MRWAHLATIIAASYGSVAIYEADTPEQQAKAERKREAQRFAEECMAATYAETPKHPQTRQQRRAAERKARMEATK